MPLEHWKITSYGCNVIKVYMEAVLAQDHDLGPAKETYAGFIALFKWGTVVAVVATALVVLIIASRAA
jgi:hypothetical protein